MESFIYKIGFIACFVGVASIVIGLLPHDKMERVRAYLGGDMTKNQNPSPRVRLLTVGAISLFFGLRIFHVI